MLPASNPPHCPVSCCAQRKPWGEMLDRSSFSKPGNMQEAYSRLRRNAGYFRVNYLVIAVLTIAGSFITHPSSLLVLAGLMALWVYMFAIKQGPLVLGDKEFRCAGGCCSAPSRHLSADGAPLGVCHHVCRWCGCTAWTSSVRFNGSKPTCSRSAGRHAASAVHQEWRQAGCDAGRCSPTVH